mmetsp:Transcript_33051/g.72482  ORF Transcript_33051/g.72482 Transcript_33051/m.72482 type:complete len:569 (+) Transcript_33051:165-1871(+)
MAMELDLPSRSDAAASAASPEQPGGGRRSSIFDLESYISRYDAQSETRLQRLLLIGSKSSAEETGRAAYVLAERQMRDTANVLRYREVFGGASASAAGGVGGGGDAAAAGSGSGEAPTESAPESTASTGVIAADASATNITADHNPAQYGLLYDTTFVSNTERTSLMHLETLEARLSTAQAHLAKEAIRTAYLALAEFHRLRGDLKESLRHVLRSRDFCTNTRQTGQVCLMVIELGVDMRNYMLVRDYVTKAEHTSDLLHTDPLFASKLRVASSLAHVHDGRYAEAARKMATVSPELTNQFNTVIAPEDIALYGALLGMAALDRSELQELILDSSTFKGRLELVPVLREALRHYVLAEYGPCLSLLSGLLPDLSLDIHLRPHAETLFNMIRDRCVVQYFTPYSKVSLQIMGDCFGTPLDSMERIVANLLKTGKIRCARINSLEKTLVAESPEQFRRRKKAETRKRVAKLGRTFLNETESMILRLSCVENDLIIGDGRKGGGGGWGGYGGGGRSKGRGRIFVPGGAGGGQGGMGAMEIAGMYGIDDEDSSDGDDVMDVDDLMAINPESV